jgi:hypothetical protein
VNPVEEPVELHIDMERLYTERSNRIFKLSVLL